MYTGMSRQNYCLYDLVDVTESKVGLAVRASSSRWKEVCENKRIYLPVCKVLGESYDGTRTPATSRMSLKARNATSTRPSRNNHASISTRRQALCVTGNINIATDNFDSTPTRDGEFD